MVENMWIKINANTNKGLSEKKITTVINHLRISEYLNTLAGVNKNGRHRK